MLIHTRDKPFICTLCENKFTFKSELERHMSIHTLGKLYTCILCDKEFIQSDILCLNIQVINYMNVRCVKRSIHTLVTWNDIMLMYTGDKLQT